jgi:hypothetical protein
VRRDLTHVMTNFERSRFCPSVKARKAIRDAYQLVLEFAGFTNEAGAFRRRLQKISPSHPVPYLTFSFFSILLFAILPISSSYTRILRRCTPPPTCTFSSSCQLSLASTRATWFSHSARPAARSPTGTPGSHPSEVFRHFWSLYSGGAARFGPTSGPPNFAPNL